MKRFYFILGLIVVFSISNLSADTLTVTNLDDSGPGSLRQAVLDSSDGDTIQFSVKGTITLTSYIEITHGLLIDGPGKNVLSISGDDSTSIFYIQGEGSFFDYVVISGLTLRDGGEQINPLPKTHFSETVENGIPVGMGTAITCNNSYLIVYQCAITNCHSVSEINKYRDTTDEFISGTFSSVVLSESFGIFEECSVYGNSSGSNGGAFYTAHSFFGVVDSEIHHNSTNGLGGGIYSYDAEVYLINTKLYNNSAGIAGGGGFFDGETWTILLMSSVYSNQSGMGGGFLLNYSMGEYYNSSFYYNTADYEGGGIFGIGELYMENCTVSGNTAGSYSGGIGLMDSFSVMSSCTITNNQANGIAPKKYKKTDNWSIERSTLDNGGGGLSLYFSQCLMINTILGENTSPDETYFNLYLDESESILKSYGYNLCDGNLAAFNAPGDITNGILNLGPLENNGGQTLTHDLMEGSDAIDAITEDTEYYEIAPDIDQREVLRPKGIAKDIGAVEKIIYVNVEVSSGENGHSNHDGTNPVEWGDDFSVLFFPDEGYIVDTVYIDNEPVGNPLHYTLMQVITPHSIHVSFKTDELPVIDSFTASPESGFTPMDVEFTVIAHDPDGSLIVKYHWDFDGDGEVDVVTETGVTNFTYKWSGIYYPIVYVEDEQGNLITVTGPMIEAGEPYPFVIAPGNISAKKAVPEYFYQNNNNEESQQNFYSTHYIINMRDLENTITLKGMDADGKFTEEIEIIMPEKGKLLLSEEIFSSATEYAHIQSDQQINVVNIIKGEHSRMASLYPVPLKLKFYIPHITEETDFWTCYSVISLSEKRKLEFNVDSNVFKTESNFVSNFNLNALNSGVSSEKSWGMVHAFDPSPNFMNSEVMSGYEMFVKNGGDGAAIELISRGSETIFIPHIPSETNLFWTGFTFMNVSEETTASHFIFYDESGTVCGEFDMELEPEKKLKGTIDELFEGMAGIAVWGKVESTGKIIAAELYGTFEAGICGYSLPYETSENSVLPLVIDEEGWWNSLSVTNPNSTPVIITLRVRNADGDIQSQLTQTIQGFYKFKGTLNELFPEITFNETDYLELTADSGVLAIQISGTDDWSYMVAIGAAN